MTGGGLGARVSGKPSVYDVLDLPTIVGLRALGLDVGAINPLTDISYDRKFGSNPDVGTAFEDIWQSGSAMYWPDAAQTLDVVSASGNDTSAGTGARSVFLQGLDASFDLITETVNLSGATPVTTSNSYIRLNRAYVVDVGGASYPTSALAAAGTGSNEGNITITRTTGGQTMGLITAGESQTQLLRYTVPNGKSAVIRSTRLFVDSTKSVDIRGKIRLDADDVTAAYRPWRIILNWPGLTSSVGATADFGVAFPAKTDIVLQAKANTGGKAVSGVLDILLATNPS